ncbi:MAG: hypothetical protein R3E58_06930 [Phycisphaerae bacterium]|nr:hypothetical protein [Phycisphaerales bacterium]
MNHPQVIVLGYSEAGMLLRKPGSANVQAIIAIHGQREFAVECDDIPHRLLLQFDDAESPRADDPIQTARIQLRQREANEFGLNLSPPTVEHAKAIIEFANSIAGIEGTLLCQCQGGISRSSAAALLCLATWTGPGNEGYCVEHLLSVRPSVIPHCDLVAFGDEVLHRNRALVEFLRAQRPF